MKAIYFLVYGFPLLSFLYALVWFLFFPPKKNIAREKSISVKFIEYMALVFSFLALLITSIQLFEIIKEGKILSDSFLWAELGTTTLQIDIRIDSLTAFFQFLVAFIVFVVHIYSLVYLKSKKPFYYGVLGLFVFAIQSLLAQDNLILFFVFWELVGLASFLFIDFNKTASSSRAATKSFLLNRLGDAGLLMAIGLLFSYSLSFSDLRTAFSDIPFSSQFIITIGVALAALVKSGQFPFSTWLSDAMEAPTSVSALLHAATMVAAGVYLLVRMEFIFSEVEILTQILLYLVLFSVVFSALSAYFFSNLKTMLAASTVSQLGFMLTAIGAGAYQAGVLHLFTHAFFKASLFLGAGFLITKFGTKEMARMGKNNYKKFPLFFVVYGLALAALVGVPLTSGFLSKEWILKETLSKNIVIGIGLFLVTFLTAFYGGRQLQLLFFNRTQGEKPKETFFTAAQTRLWYLPLFLLFGGSFWFVFSFYPLHPDESFWIEKLPRLFPNVPNSFKIWLPVLASLLTLLGLYLGFSEKISDKLNQSKLAHIKNYFLWQDRFFIFFFWKPLTQLAILTAQKQPLIQARSVASFWVFVSRFLALADRKLDKQLNHLSKLMVALGAFLAWLDKYFIDGVSHIVVFLTNYLGKFFRSFQNGKVQFYLLVIAIIFLIILLFVQ